MATKHTKKPRIGLSSAQLDAARLGPIASQYKAKASPGQWKQLVKLAHSKGFAVDSFLDPNTPDALKARTQSSLRKQALSSVNAAYAPAEQQFSQEESRVNALADKRRTDNEHYNNWIAAQSAQLQAHNDAAQALVNTQQQQIGDAANAQRQAAHGELAHDAQQTNGNVSDPNKSTAFGQDLTAANDRNRDMVSQARLATQAAVGQSTEHQAAYDASNIAIGAANEAKRQSDLYTSLASIGDDRQKMALQKAADANDEVSKLLQGEVTKAQSQRDYGLAQASLNVKQDQVNLDTTKANQTFKNNTAKTAETKRHNQAAEKNTRVAARDRQMNADNKYNLDKKKFGAAQAKENWLKKHQRGAYAPKSPSKSQKPDLSGFGQITDLAVRIGPRAKNPAKLSQAKKDLLGTNNKEGAPHSPLNVQAAAEVAKYGHVSGRTYRRLTESGIYVPKDRRPK